MVYQVTAHLSQIPHLSHPHMGRQTGVALAAVRPGVWCFTVRKTWLHLRPVRGRRLTPSPDEPVVNDGDILQAFCSASKPLCPAAAGRCAVSSFTILPPNAVRKSNLNIQRRVQFSDVRRCRGCARQYVIAHAAAADRSASRSQQGAPAGAWVAQVFPL